MITVSAPGKLFLSGEWAILEVGNPGIVAAVNKRVFCSIKGGRKVSITIDDFGIKDLQGRFDGRQLRWERELSDREREQTMFIKGAIETTLQYLGRKAKRGFAIRSWGEESQIEVGEEVRKVGFGSSAAACVAAVAAILKFHGIGIRTRKGKERVYKLAAIAHYFAQGKVGSAFDIAASTYGGIFVYQRFDPGWLVGMMEGGAKVKWIVNQPWQSFVVEPLEIPRDFRLLIGWTKESASTSAMVKQLNEWAGNNKGEYDRLYNQIANLVRELIPAWKAGNGERIMRFIRRNEDCLRELGRKSGVSIETEGLRILSEAANQNGGAGKLSGAGGGDCGIAICFDPKAEENIKRAWEENGLYLIDATVDREGIKVEN